MTLYVYSRMLLSCVSTMLKDNEKMPMRMKDK